MKRLQVAQTRLALPAPPIDKTRIAPLQFFTDVCYTGLLCVFTVHYSPFLLFHWRLCRGPEGRHWLHLHLRGVSTGHPESTEEYKYTIVL